MMREVLNNISMDGVVVIGEGEKDEVSGLDVQDIHMSAVHYGLFARLQNACCVPWC